MLSETRRRTKDQAWGAASPWGRRPLAFSPRGSLAKMFVCVCGCQAVTSDGSPPAGWLKGDGDHWYCPNCWQGRAA